MVEGIRLATLADVEEIAKLEQEIFSSPWSENTLIDAMKQEHFYFVVAEVEGIIVAYAGLYHVGDEGFVCNIASSPTHRGKGLGKAVTKGLLQWGEEKGFFSLSLEVRASNAVAINLYTTLGFTTLGRRKNFYHKPTEDGLIMTYYYKEA